MRHVRLPVLMAVTVACLSTSTPAHADKTFHTTTFALVPVAGSTVTGSVVDVHTQGTRVYAQERYRLRGAEAGVTYAIQLTAYQDASCKEIAFVVPASPTTTANRAGNASARRTFPVPGPEAGTAHLRWQVLTSGGALVAETACATVPLD